jgi:hypothetical protein
MEQQPYVYTSLYDGSQLPAERQLKFLVPESFYRRLRTEKLLRKRTFQDLLNEALEQALHAWDRDRADEEDAFRDTEEEHALSLGLIDAKSESFHLRKGEYRWVRMWIDFMRELPEQTVAAMKQAIEDYLRYFRSSRLKGPSGSADNLCGEGDGDGKTRSE